MALHRCTEKECPFLGEPTSRSCGCHKTDDEVLRAVIREMLAADDAMLSFVLGADPHKMGEGEWSRLHAERSARRHAAVVAARAAVA